MPDDAIKANITYSNPNTPENSKKAVYDIVTRFIDSCQMQYFAVAEAMRSISQFGERLMLDVESGKSKPGYIVYIQPTPQVTRLGSNKTITLQSITELVGYTDSDDNLKDLHPRALPQPGKPAKTSGRHKTSPVAKDKSAKMRAGEIAKHHESGKFEDFHAKAFIVFMYSLWDENYRNQIAKELSIAKDKVKYDLMGDLRLIRNCIVHDNSVIDDGTMKDFKALHKIWKAITPRKFLLITKYMIGDLLEQIESIQLRIDNR